MDGGASAVGGPTTGASEQSGAPARQQGAPEVQKTLQYMLMHTANAAMTEGNKMAIRHMGQAMNSEVQVSLTWKGEKLKTCVSNDF